MSCIGFMSPQQRRLLRASTADGAALSSFASPEITEGKITRLRAMAGSADPKIRESAALAYAAPCDVLERLATDPDTGVRCCVARNQHTPAEVLGQLATDLSAGVRGWVAANPSCTPVVLRQLSKDPSSTVCAVAAWALRW